MGERLTNDTGYNSGNDASRVLSIGGLAVRWLQLHATPVFRGIVAWADFGPGEKAQFNTCLEDLNPNNFDSKYFYQNHLFVKVISRFFSRHG
jgi:hypothetical protein